MPDVFVIGDSHAVVICNAFVARGWSVYGGALQMGRAFEESFFELIDGHVTFNDDFAHANFSRSLANAKVSRLTDLDMPVLTTMGFNSHRLVQSLCKAEGLSDSDDPPPFSSAVMSDVVASVRGPVIEFYKSLPSNRTYAALSPQRSPPKRIPLVRSIEQLLVDKLAPLGVQIIDVRDRTTDESGVLREEFWRASKADQAHANDAYGAVVVERFIELQAASAAPSPNINTRPAS